MNIEKPVQKNSSPVHGATAPKVLGIRTRVRTEARVRSGCGKSSNYTCGISYRSG